MSCRREPSPIKDDQSNPAPCLLSKEDVEKDDDEDFWMNTCNSFVVQLAETQEKQKTKVTPIKKKMPKEQLPQQPKRKYTRRIKIEPTPESEQNNKIPPNNIADKTLPKSVKKIKPVKSAQDNNCDDKQIKTGEPLDVDKENETKLIDREKKVDEESKEESIERKPEKKRKLNTSAREKSQKNIYFNPHPFISTKWKKRQEMEKKKSEKKEMLKKDGKKEPMKKEGKKEVQIKKEEKSEKKELLSKDEKKILKKEEKRDSLKKEKEDKKDIMNKKENKKETAKKKVMEKENSKIENLTRRSEGGKFNPRQSLRRKNSLKDYSFAFDELLDDTFVHFEEEKITTKRRKKQCNSRADSPVPIQQADNGPGTATTKKHKEKDLNETIRMRLRSRSRPLANGKHQPQEQPKKRKMKNVAKNVVVPKRRRKKSLGEKSAMATSGTAADWKDELYKFKRSLRLPSKLISVVSPPTGDTVAADQVSLTSIMDIVAPNRRKPTAKELKGASTTATAVQSVAGKSGKVVKRLGHLFGRRDVFKGRRMKREKIVSAEKLMQRNCLRKKRQEDEKKVVVVAAPETASGGKDSASAATVVDEMQQPSLVPPARMLFKRKFMRKKFRSGFDYIKKKKKKGLEPMNERKPTAATSIASIQSPKQCAPRFLSEIQAEIKGWIVNKGHGETVLHRAARLGVKVCL